MRWHIRGFDSHEPIYDEWVPRRVSDKELKQILARLQCQHLSESEALAFKLEDLVGSNRGGKLPGYMTLLNPYYVASYDKMDTKKPRKAKSRSDQDRQPSR